jgi:hypothetical protein
MTFEDIYEAMLVSVFVAPLVWLAIISASFAAIFLRKRIGTLAAAGLITAIAIVTWFHSIWIENQCVNCNHVARIYQIETRWGLVFWAIAFLGILLAMQAYSARQAKRIEKEV